MALLGSVSTQDKFINFETSLRSIHLYFQCNKSYKNQPSNSKVTVENRSVSHEDGWAQEDPKFQTFDGIVDHDASLPSIVQNSMEIVVRKCVFHD